MRGGIRAATQTRGVHRRLHEGKADGEREKELAEHAFFVAQIRPQSRITTPLP